MTRFDSHATQIVCVPAAWPNAGTSRTIVLSSPGSILVSPGCHPPIIDVLSLGVTGQNHEAPESRGILANIAPSLIVEVSRPPSDPVREDRD